MGTDQMRCSVQSERNNILHTPNNCGSKEKWANGTSIEIPKRLIETCTISWNPLNFNIENQFQNILDTTRAKQSTAHWRPSRSGLCCLPTLSRQNFNTSEEGERGLASCRIRVQPAPSLSPHLQLFYPPTPMLLGLSSLICEERGKGKVNIKDFNQYSTPGVSRPIRWISYFLQSREALQLLMAQELG